MVGITKKGDHNSGTYVYYHCSNNSKAQLKEKNINETLIDEAMQEVIESFDVTEKEIKVIKKEKFNAIDDLKKYEHKSIEELRKQYDDVVDSISSH